MKKKGKSLHRVNSAISGRISKENEIKYALTPEQMYFLDSHKDEIGIEGYEVPRHYYDYHQVMWEKKRNRILTSHKHVWPPDDWPKDKDSDTKVKPKRKTYIDELYKWCNSYYDPKKRQALIEEKNINVKEYVPPNKTDKIRRKNFLENEKKKEEFFKGRPPYPEYKSEAMEAAAEKKKEAEEAKKDPIEKIKQRYKERPQTSRCDRVSVVSEAIHVGEQVPFYNTFVPEGKELDKNKLFFPSKKLILPRSPSWKYPKPIGPNEEHKKAAADAQKEKIEEYMNENNLKKEDLWINIRDAYHKVTHHGEIKMKIAPEFKYQEVDQYKVFLENFPKVYIGPQQYWKVPKENFRKGGKRSLSTITDDKGNKVYYMDRKKTDKRVFTAGLRKAVY